VLLVALLAELLWFDVPVVLLLLLLLLLCVCVLCDVPLSVVVPAAHAPTMKQSEKIPVERKNSARLSIVKLSRLPLLALTLEGRAARWTARGAR
jgi:hypothetical protein